MKNKQEDSREYLDYIYNKKVQKVETDQYRNLKLNHYPDCPHNVMKCLRKRTMCPKVLEIEERARQALKQGNIETFHALRREYYTLTGFWF